MILKNQNKVNARRICLL